jgi:hypothetical protein
MWSAWNVAMSLIPKSFTTWQSKNPPRRKSSWTTTDFPRQSSERSFWQPHSMQQIPGHLPANRAVPQTLRLNKPYAGRSLYTPRKNSLFCPVLKGHG